MPLTEREPGQLNRLRMRVRALGDARARATLHEVLAAGAMTELQNGFVESRNPYGEDWEGLKTRDGQPLRNDGHMAASAHPNQKPDGFSITMDQGHPKVHQDGMTIYPRAAAALRFMVRGVVTFAKKVVIPQRMMFPTKRRGLGSWGEVLNRDASAFVRRILTGGGQ